MDETTDWDRKMAAKVKEMYFGSDDISKQTLKQFIKLSGDYMFYGGTEVAMRELVKSNPHNVYRYMYSHRGNKEAETHRNSLH